MSAMIQSHKDPDDPHRELKSRAARVSMSLSDYLLAETGQIAERPTIEALLARLASLSPVISDLSAADAVRAERDSR
jgi:hypothetical protein